ncbi:MAG TPA: DUF4893 domain-containing protein [Rhizomicrobium sp.]|nr:DUF4893 domain-containing protein [Rhizomicrobium sp.]
MRGTTLKALLAVTSLAMASNAAYAAWEDYASQYDASRIAKLDESRAAGLQEAARGPARDVAAIHAVLDRSAHPASLAELSGTWHCRTMKLGGMEPTKVYSWFTCRISAQGGRATFEKFSGTQHFGGTLLRHESGGFVLLAGMNVARDRAAHYSGNSAYIGADTTPSDAVGLLSSTGPGSARIEFPYPAQESVFDVIELKR